MAATRTTRAQRNASVTEIAPHVQKHNRTYGIITAIAMIVLGVMFLIWPMVTGYVGMIFITVGLIVYGVTEIVVYCRTPKEYRNGWMLAFGIIYVVLGCMLLADDPASLYLTYAFTIGFFAMYLGVTQCFAWGQYRAQNVPGSGWLLASGIINIILSFCMIMTPIVAAWALEYVLGIYLIIAGVALFAEACSGKYGIRM